MPYCSYCKGDGSAHPENVFQDHKLLTGDVLDVDPSSSPDSGRDFSDSLASSTLPYPPITHRLVGKQRELIKSWSKLFAAFRVSIQMTAPHHCDMLNLCITMQSMPRPNIAHSLQAMAFTAPPPPRRTHQLPSTSHHGFSHSAPGSQCTLVVCQKSLSVPRRPRSSCCSQFGFRGQGVSLCPQP